MAKATEAFRNIGEVAVELGVKKHVLRFWELKFPQLKPMKRGGGRRLYRPSDVELLRGIRDLLQSAGYTIKGVQRLLREHGIDHVKLTGSAVTTLPPGQAKRSTARLAVVKNETVRLGAQQVEALRAVMAELDACQRMLAAARDKTDPLSDRLAE